MNMFTRFGGTDDVDGEHKTPRPGRRRSLIGSIPIIGGGGGSSAGPSTNFASPNRRMNMKESKLWGSKGNLLYGPTGGVSPALPQTSMVKQSSVGKMPPVSPLDQPKQKLPARRRSSIAHVNVPESPQKPKPALKVVAPPPPPPPPTYASASASPKVASEKSLNKKPVNNNRVAPNRTASSGTSGTQGTQNSGNSGRVLVRKDGSRVLVKKDGTRIPVIRTASGRLVRIKGPAPPATPKTVTKSPVRKVAKGSVTPRPATPRKSALKNNDTTSPSTTGTNTQSPMHSVTSTSSSPQNVVRRTNKQPPPRRVSPKPMRQPQAANMYRRASLQHVPCLDGPPPLEPASPIKQPVRRQMSNNVQPPGPPVVAGRNRPSPYMNQDWPQTPVVHHSPLKRNNRKIIVDELDGLHLNIDDIEEVDGEADQTEEDEYDEEDEQEPAVVSKNTRLYEYARTCDWDSVSEECRQYPRDAKCVDETDGTTALHLAVMSRANPSLRDGVMGDLQPAPIQLIEQLVVACPEAAITRCSVKKYTPLTYACLVLDRGYNMVDSAAIVSILLHHAPQSAYVFTDDGFSALDVHILSYSRFHHEKKEAFTSEKASTLVLKTLLTAKPDLAEARSYKNRVRGPVELLYRSNLEDFKHIEYESSVTDWWAWKWVTLLLNYAPRPGGQTLKDGPFTALHAASGLVGCPLPVLAIAANSYPDQLAQPDPRGILGNLPLHEVCSWVCDQESINGDPFVLRRKAMAIECLLNQFPQAAEMTNYMGETPLVLAIESCTPWNCGLAALVHAYPEAVLITRKLRPCNDQNDILISRAIFEDNDSVDSDWVDPLEAVEGMYPFMVAAVVAHVPDSKRKAPSFVFSEESPEQRNSDMERKDLESLRTIYELLRAKPEALVKYKPVYKHNDDEECTFADDSDYSDYTEVTFEE